MRSLSACGQGTSGVEPTLEEQLRGVLRERRLGHLAAGAPAVAHSHRKNDAPTNSVSESTSRFTFPERDCTLELSAGLTILRLSTKLQIACHSLFDSERMLFTRIRYLSQLAPALASFGAEDILQGGECRRQGRRAPQGAPGTRPGSVR